MFKTIFSKEGIFALFLFSGYFKSSLSFLPFDITIFLMMISFITVINTIINQKAIEKKTLNGIVLFLPFLILILVSNLYTESNYYAIEKTIKFLTFTSWAFIAPFFIIKGKKSFLNFLNTIIIISTIVAIATFITYLTSYSGIGFISVYDIGYQQIGRLTGLGSILITTLGLYNINVSIKQKYLYTLLLLVNVFSLTISGSRMPLLSFLCSLILLFLISFRYEDKKLYIDKGVYPFTLVLVLLLGIFLYFIATGRFNTTFNRLLTLFFEEGGGGSSIARINRYETALLMTFSSPIFGHGIGSFPIHYNLSDVADYPHNILLEFSSELGFIGLSIFLILIIKGFIGIYKSKKNILRLSIMFSTFYLLLNAMVSGSINDNRIIFTFIAFMLILPKIKTNKIIT